MEGGEKKREKINDDEGESSTKYSARPRIYKFISIAISRYGIYMSLFFYSKNQQISKLTIYSLSFDEALVIKWKVLPSLSTYIVLTDAIFSMFAFGALSALQKLQTGLDLLSTGYTMGSD
jgi:hypothetical protein